MVFTIVFLGFIAYEVYDHFFVDHEPPVITMDRDVIEMSVSDPTEKLLSGVTANDNTDGDLTSSVIIRGVSQLITDDSARVSYIVFDSADNMATAQRTVRYVDYERPHFSLSKPLIFPQNEVISFDEMLVATDRLDGDLTPYIRVTAQNVNVAIEGTYSISVMVTNSLGDSEMLSLPVIISNQSASIQQLRLSRYILYIDRDSPFDPLSLITFMADETGQRIEKNTDEVQVLGNIDTRESGVYQLAYTYHSYTVYLTVVVK